MDWNALTPKRCPRAFRHRRRADDLGRCHDRLYIPPRGRAAPSPKPPGRKLRIPLRHPQLERARESTKQIWRQRNLSNKPRLRRFKVSMQATPLSMSIAAGVSANTSEIRAPLQRNVRQNNRIDSGGRRAALTERCRSAALRYFRLSEGPNRLWLSCGRSRIAAPAETEWPILFQQEIYSQITANLHTATQMPCRFFGSAWQIFRF